MTALEWLDTLTGATRKPLMPYMAEQPTMLQYLAELIYANGGSGQVKQFGKVQMGIGAYGRIGLKLEEAFHLTELAGMLEGLTLGSFDVQTTRLQVQEKIQAEINCVEDQFNKFGKQIVLPGVTDVAQVEKSRIITG